MVTSYDLYELLLRACDIADLELMPVLFFAGDNNERFPQGRDGKSPKTNYSVSKTRFFSIKENINRPNEMWCNGICEHPDMFFENIGDSIGEVTNSDKLELFHEQLSLLCRTNKMQEYISDGYFDFPSKEACAQMFYVLFMQSIDFDFESNSFYGTRMAKKDSKVHFNQVLSLNSNVEFNIDKPDCQFFIKNPRLLVIGPGGQGKSYFLKELEALPNLNSYYSILRIDLPEILTELSKRNYSQNNGVQDVQSVILKIRYSDKDEYVNSIIERATNTVNQLSKRKNKPVLLLLDGYNEIFLSSNHSAISLINNEIARMTKEWSNAHIVITCRANSNSNIKNIYPTIGNYTLASLSGVSETDYLLFVQRHHNITSEVNELAHIPMYFKHLVSFQESLPDNKYQLLLSLYNSLVEQSSTRNTQSATSFDSIDVAAQNSHEFFCFYILCPYLAHKVNKEKKLTFNEKDIREAIDQIMDNKHDEYFLESIMLSSFTHFSLQNFKDLDKTRLLNIIKHRSLLTSSPEYTSFKFFHDDIRDFLEAYYITCTLNMCRNAFLNKNETTFSSIDFDVNVSNDVEKLAKDALGLSPNAEKGFCSFFEPLLSKEYYCFDDSTIIFANSAFLLYEYFHFNNKNLDEKLHSFFLPIQNDISTLLILGNNSVSDITSSFSEKNNDYCLHSLCHILCKESEYYRRRYDFDNAIKMVEMAETICPNQNIVINQKAKAYLCRFQYWVQQSDSSYNPNDFEIGFNMLKANSYYLSANLLAMIYSAPAPYLVDTLSITSDYVEAFDAGYSIIKNHSEFRRRDIDYTIRQAVSLLLKGNVKLSLPPQIPGYSKSLMKKLSINNFINGDNNSLNIDNNTILFAEDLLNLADGQYLNSMNYLRALVSYHKGACDEAKRLLLSEDKNILNQIYLNYRFDATYDLNSSYLKLIEWITNKDNLHGEIDKCHQIYWYCDAKNLEISFNPNCINKFKEYERNFPEICKNIVKQLTR